MLIETGARGIYPSPFGISNRSKPKLSNRGKTGEKDRGRFLVLNSALDCIPLNTPHRPPSSSNRQIPFSMSMDFNEIAKALKDINYSGYLTLEADRYLADSGFNSENILDGLKNLANSAKRLGEIIKAI